jgi:hypothetical protein
MSIHLSREASILLIICLLDTLSSAIVFSMGMATEANPLLRPFAEAGIPQFVLAKTFTFLPAILIAERYARVRPEFVRPLFRWAIIAYITLYAVFVAGLLLK